MIQTNKYNLMNAKSLISFILTVPLLLAACSREPAEPGGPLLTVELGPEFSTKAIMGATAAEKKVNSLDLYVFDANGLLDISHACSAAEISAGKAVMRVKTGGKTVWALANFNDALRAQTLAKATLDELGAVAVQLEDNVADGLLMTASASANVVAGQGGSVSLDLGRSVARVALGSVTNKLPAPYGTVTVLRAFLCNVAGNQNVRGDAGTTSWLNRNATPDNAAANHVIGTGNYVAQAKALTFAELGDDVALNGTKQYEGRFFYAFPNALTSPNNGFSATFSPTATVLMVVVKIKGVDYYYPVPLTGGLERNKDYKVDLTLIGLGNTQDRPFDKIEKADLTATVRVSDWATGAVYTESI